MHPLQQAFEEYVGQEKLFSRHDRLLIAVSGGLDSCVLLHLLVSCGYPVVLAHCNFRLRGAESDRDEEFCRSLAVHYNADLHVRTFDTGTYASEQKLSTQEAARELRYRWFGELADHHGFNRILTAHHADDNVETMLMNLFKGTGITGLRGMLPLVGRIARPLLFATRKELEEYASVHGLSFVEDSSNVTDKYTRNFFRHHVIPLVENVIPGAMDHCREDIRRFREVESVYREAMDRKIATLVTRKGEEVHVPVEKLRLATPFQSMVFELFSPAGFSATQVAGIIRLMDAETGRYIDSPSHRLLKNRNWFILTPHTHASQDICIIPEPGHTVTFPNGSLDLHLEPAVEVREVPGDKMIACIDASQVQFPLILRRWKEGDYFYPLGMPKKKKVARFLIDNKVPRHEKEKTWVVESAGRIIWVVGHRIDNRVRVRPSTSMILVMKWLS
jgi:tRNA(Ile)-lysidine synthase